MTNKLTLMAIFAHPDDEVFGTGGSLTKYANEGVEVHLVMATRGEVGQVSNPTITPIEPISLLREQELRCACQRYGIKNLHLLGFMDGQTTIAPPSEAVYKIVKLFRQFKPQVVVSFGPEGIYGHFDHLAVHRWSTAAVNLAAEADRWPEIGPAHQVTKFYHRATAQTQITYMKERFGREAILMDGIPFPFVGYSTEQITTVIDVEEYAQTKLEAVRCYASQFNPETIYLQDDFDLVANPWFWQETFILAQVNGNPFVAPDGDKENDLFAGVR